MTPAEIVPPTLQRELETYAAHRDELLATVEGTFVLIRGDQVAGTYSSQTDAIAEGYRRFGNVPFLVKQVVRLETPVTYFTSFPR